mgnify:CR=1 FL=1
MPIPTNFFPPGENEDGEDFVNRSLIPGVLTHASDSDEPTLLIPQPPHPSDVLPTDQTLTEGQLYAPGFGPNGGAAGDTMSEADFARAGIGAGGIDLSAPPPSDLDITFAARQNSDGSFSVAAGPIAVPLEELAKIGEHTVRQCIQDALDSWATDFTRYVESGEAARSSDPINSTMMMSVFYRNVIKNLRDKEINPADVWPLVLLVIRNIFHRLVRFAFEGT